jgi:hypothetical protein
MDDDRLSVSCSARDITQGKAMGYMTTVPLMLRGFTPQNRRGPGHHPLGAEALHRRRQRPFAGIPQSLHRSASIWTSKPVNENPQSTLQTPILVQQNVVVFHCSVATSLIPCGSQVASWTYSRKTQTSGTNLGCVDESEYRTSLRRVRYFCD